MWLRDSQLEGPVLTAEKWQGKVIGPWGMSTLPCKVVDQTGEITTMATAKAVAPKIQVRIEDGFAPKPMCVGDVPVGTVFTGRIDNTTGVFVKMGDGDEGNVFYLDKLCLCWTPEDQEVVDYRVRHEVKIEVK